MSYTNRDRNVVHSNFRSSAFQTALDLLIDHLLQMERVMLPLNDEDRLKVN